MSLQKFISEAISPWMKKDGADSDIVLSSRIRLARNLKEYKFPLLATMEESSAVVKQVKESLLTDDNQETGPLELVLMEDLKANEKRVLVEKHLISPNLAEQSKHGAVILSEDESVSIMINEEDHLRIQCLFPGFQLTKGLEAASRLDDWIEERVTYAFDEKRGYLTSCPTNVGTGLRASVMMHLPALAMTRQLNKILPAINQLGLVVRGIYGEGSEALGNLFQVSNQLTLGKSEQDIVEDLRDVVMQLIQQERAAREVLMQSSKLQLEDRVYRSYGILSYSRVIESKEATQRLSDVRLGIDVGLLENVSANILNELMILTQPGFLQQYAGEVLSPDLRDERRATLIRERLKLENDTNE
ncbi:MULTISPECIES: protein arginine kinase [Alkalihalophilus]|uniref:Protein-arginine kinase n=1 Tax=Alkalihalophilus pseudofirmus (strain ATCC BAA-2126 / JCM 17055 / OF4) TaxID=398511 RepID=D3FR42_ALKPO|nr:MULTISPECIES: protein arginine kinase [Alkalihalophilus]ADC49738.1 ATP:guanido phosphotransferase [Alkalihalophilus pseudofirmus OF4]MEC2073980.1 protein arginine kinase [Alkalihalophilus marmarensis]MED1600741.1 protein arginine kinase [Alkalihalophilus marmarensis]WEG17065.1 protein arginine kinase [Alkalihalophilus pseudofirmus]